MVLDLNAQFDVNIMRSSWMNYIQESRPIEFIRFGFDQNYVDCSVDLCDEFDKKCALVMALGCPPSQPQALFCPARATQPTSRCHDHEQLTIYTVI